jgi:hypothetical protein
MQKKLNSAIDPVFVLYGGATYRIGDAIAPIVKVDFESYSFGLSYDLNISKLKTASNLRGGMECTLVKSGMFSNPKWAKSRTICPEFF